MKELKKYTHKTLVTLKFVTYVQNLDSDLTVAAKTLANTGQDGIDPERCTELASIEVETIYKTKIEV